MKSSIKMDVDDLNHPILTIKHVPSDDIRDKTVKNFLYNLLNRRRENYLKITEITKLPANGFTPIDYDVTKITFEPLVREDYIEKRFMRGSCGPEDSRTTTHYLKNLPNDEREYYMKGEWPELEIMSEEESDGIRYENAGKEIKDTFYSEINEALPEDFYPEKSLVERVKSLGNYYKNTADGRMNIGTIQAVYKLIPEDFYPNENFIPRIEKLVEYYKNTNNVKECPDCKFDFVNQKHQC